MRPARWICAIGAVLLCVPLVLLADGGTMQLRKTAGPFIVTVFSEPVPVRAGTVDLSVMLQKAADQSTLLDAYVMLRLRKTTSGSIVEVAAPATHEHATNKLLYAGSVTLPSAGVWQMTVDVRENGDSASASGDIDVLPAEPPVREHWPLFALVPLMILLFVLNQWLKSRRNRARGRA
jgi:hypothetical protein